MASLPAGVTNPLGFGPFGGGIVPACARGACSSGRTFNVNICVAINDTTCVTIQQGCLAETSSDADCIVDYNAGVLENSWGRKCRVVHFNRIVPANTILRLRFCACSPCAPCGTSGSGDVYLNGRIVPNKLLKFEVDGVDFTSYLQSITPPSESVGFGCTRVQCTGGVDNGCCLVDEFTSLQDIPPGAEIRFGAIGNAMTAL